MVTVKAAHLRSAGEKSFVTLELTGDLELVQSQNTGRFYATTRRTFVSSTFDEKTAEQFVGKQIPGTIVKVNSEPYDYEVPETGEVLTYMHKYVYQPELETTPVVTKKQLEFSENTFESQLEMLQSQPVGELLDF
ncbi:MAG: hypothetical protein H0W75_02470 [Chitinophagaceae bacterium]|nr:hypothetical protein [Chitinophagaceae bacterium]